MLDFQINHAVPVLEDYFQEFITTRFAECDRKILLDGVEVSKHYHAGQTRSDGISYVSHPLRVALLIGLHERPDRDLLLAGLLHDTLEDTSLTAAEIGEQFGGTVRRLVEGVTNPTSVYLNAAHRKSEKLKKWQNTMQAPHDVRVVKTFDGLDNLIALKFIPPRAAHHVKIPRWLMQAVDMKLPLAKITNQQAHDMMLQELASYRAAGLVAGDWSSD